MANVARYHRRSSPKKSHLSFRILEKDLRQRIKKLSAILRIADGLDRSHFQNVKAIEIVNEKKKFSISIFTESDSELEIWGAMRKSELFEEVTGKKLKIFAGNEHADFQKKININT
jgi:exopolyphosphatase/guanosine-5'-triphosphate,3'-diphosphate pyrophosphatase